MIKKPTVLILGAGASIPYGYPSGEDLLNEIVLLLFESANNPHASLLGLSGFNQTELSTFANALKKSQLNSIDAFLENQPKFIPIGKAAIAICLVQREDERRLFDHKRKQGVEDWYRYLFNCLKTTTKDEFKCNRLTILTYNYDRSIDHFLVEAVRNTFGLNEKELKDVIWSIPIRHLHGSLGNLPIIDIDSRPYTLSVGPQELGPKGIKKMAENINIVHEEVMTAYDDAYEILDKAERICFLGFGYHEENLERLFKGDWNKEEKWIGGTTFGLKEMERKSIQTLIRRLGGHHFNVENGSWGNLEFLREKGILLNDDLYHDERMIR